MRAQFPITDLCHALGVCRSGYLAARCRKPGPRARANAELVAAIKTVHAHRHMRTYGSPRLTRELQARGQRCSRHRVARLMRLHGLAARPRRSFCPKTTTQDRTASPSPNLLAQAGPPMAPGTQIVSDITYIPTAEGWLYLAIVLDLYSRAILGWKVADSLHTELVTGALEKALATGLIAVGAIFHSDRGSQYSAQKTRTLLAQAGLRQSMSAKGYCYDNAFAESAFATIKADVLPAYQSFASRPAARLALFDYLETFYNRHRRHSSLDHQAPNTVLHQYFQNLKPHLN
jgi:transposase InsO family protein